MARALLWLSIMTFGGLGAVFTMRPDAMSALSDIVLPTATSRVDVAATYGGFELGFAAFLVWCAIAADRVRIGLTATGLALSGFGLVRLASILSVTGPVSALMWWLTGVELGSAIAIFVVVRSARVDGHRPLNRD